MKKTLLITSAFALFVGAAVAANETYVVNVGETVVVNEDVIQDYSGDSFSQRLTVNGGSLTIDGDLINTVTDLVSYNFASGISSAGVADGTAIVTGTVKTTINGSGTSLGLNPNPEGKNLNIYAGNVGNQIGNYGVAGVSQVGAVEVVVNDGYVHGIVGSGAMNSNVLGNITMNVAGGYVEALWGAATGTVVGGNININVSGGKVDHIHGGGDRNTVTGISSIEGSVNVVVEGSAVVGNIYAGGWGGYYGEAYVDTIKGGTSSY